MGQNRNKDQDSPRQSTMEPAEGSRDSGRNSESQDASRDQTRFNDGDAGEQRGSGSSGERGRDSNSSERNSGGITNRGRDREMAEQEQLPDRGHSQSER